MDIDNVADTNTSSNANQVEDVTQDSPNMDTEVTETPKEVPRTVQLVHMIHSSLRSAGNQKGGFTFSDIRQLTKARDSLVTFFSADSQKTTSVEITALDTLIKCCEFQQSTGVFTFEGSLNLLNAFEELSKALEDAKTPGQKMNDMRNKLGVGSKPKNTPHRPNQKQQNQQVKK